MVHINAFQVCYKNGQIACHLVHLTYWVCWIWKCPIYNFLLIYIWLSLIRYQRNCKTGFIELILKSYDHAADKITVISWIRREELQRFWINGVTSCQKELGQQIWSIGSHWEADLFEINLIDIDDVISVKSLKKSVITV